jgi:hypothetical protein
MVLGVIRHLLRSTARYGLFFSDHRNATPQTASGGGFDVYTVNVQ